MLSAQIIILIVGSGFVVFGLSSLIGFYRHKRLSHSVTGYIYAIEKYEDTVSDVESNNTYDTFFYRPLVKYLWQGKERLVKGIGSSHLNYRLNRQVEVLVNADPQTGAIQARVNSFSYIMIGLAFLLMGLGAIAFYAIKLEGNLLLPLGIISIFLVIVRFFVEKKRYEIQNEEDEQEISPSSVILDTQQALDGEIKRYQTITWIVQLIFLILSVFMIYLGVNDMPDTLSNILQQGQFSELYQQIKNDELNNVEFKSLILTGMGGLFFVSVLFSIIKTRR